MEKLPWLSIWDLGLFAVVLAAGLLLYCLGGRKAAPGGKTPLGKLYGRRMMAASVLFLVAAPLDLWKAGLGVVIWIAGTMAVLAWCMVTLCQRLDDRDDA